MNDNGKITAALDRLLSDCPSKQSEAAVLGATLTLVADRLRTMSPRLADKALSTLAVPCVCLAVDIQPGGSRKRGGE